YGLGDRPDAARPRVMGAARAQFVDDQSGTVKAETVGVRIEGIDVVLHRKPVRPLEATQQPDPFVVMARLDQLPGNARSRCKVRREVFADDPAFGAEEVGIEQLEQPRGLAKVAFVARALP